MSSGEVRKVSRQDIQLVQNLIERCLQLYMNQKEVVDTLSFQAKIEPSFTELVWQKLEEENLEFFKAYHIRLILKNQILLFNKLLEKQVELMQKACPSGVAILPIPNASHSPLLQTPSCYMSQHASTSSRPDGMFYNGDFSSALVNGRSSEHQGNYLESDSSIVAGIMHASTSVLSAHNSNMGRISGLSETIIKSEPNYLNNSEFPFVSDNIILEAHRPIGDASGGSFSNSELTGQPANSTLPDVDTPSLGFSQIPRNFSFSDLSDDFSHCAGLF